MSLSHWQCHDAADVVVFRTELLFAEVADEMGAGIVRLRHNVKQERFDVIEERFMVQEHLGEKAEVLAVDLVLTPVDLEYGYTAIAIDLVSRWVSNFAFQLANRRRQIERMAGHMSQALHT